MGSTSSKDDIDSIAASIAEIMANDPTVVDKQTRIYLRLGLRSGSDLNKLELDSKNDSWKFFNGMLQKYIRKETNVSHSIEQLIELLNKLELRNCANQIEELQGDNTVKEQPPNKKILSQQFLYNIAGTCPSFIGRCDELEKLEKLVFSNDTNSGAETGRLTVLTSVSGMGGIGKTMLARKFSNTFRDKYSGNVAWISCDTLNLAQSAFTDIAKQLNLAHQKDISLKELAKLVYDFLKVKSRKSLFIFDNLDDPNADWIVDIYPSLEDNIYILITSRRRDVLPTHNTLDLDVLSSQDAIDLVDKYLPGLSKDLATELTKQFGFFPLALRIATSNISRARRPVNIATREYIQTFSLETEKIRTVQYFELDGYNLTTYASIKISLDKIGEMENGKDVRHLLGAMSFLHPDCIKKEFVVKISSKMKKTQRPNLNSLDNCPETLDSYSFITTVVTYGEYYYYKIHRLIQKLVQFELKQEEKNFLLQVVVDTLCDSDDFFYDVNSKFIFDILIEESEKLCYDKKFICGMLHRLLKAAMIQYEYKDDACCPGSNKIADIFIKRHLLNGSDTNFQLIPHYFNQMQHKKNNEPDPVIKTFFNRIYDQMPTEDPIISIILLFYLLFTKPYSKTPYPNFKLLGKICGMDLNEINGKILPLEENGVISRMCTDWITKVSSKSENDSDESNHILYEGIQHSTTGSDGRICPHYSYHFSSIGYFFKNYLRKNVSRINLSLIDTILSVGVSLDFGIAVPLHLLHFKNNAPAISKYLIEHDSSVNKIQMSYGFQLLEYNMEKNQILEMLNLVPDITYGDLYSMIFHTAFNYGLHLEVYENVNFAIDVLNLLAKQIPITKEFIIRISPLLSGKIFSHSEDYELPDELKLIKINVAKEILEQDTNDELTELAFFSYLTKNSKYCFNEFLTIAPEVGKPLITIGYGYEDDSQYFYLNSLVSCVLVASATIEEQFKFYQYVVRNSRGREFEMKMLYLNTWFLLYEKLLQHENLEFVEDDLLFPLRIFIKLRFLNLVGHKLVESFSGVLHSVRLATNPVNIKWKKDLTQCFELLKMDNSLSFSEKLEELLVLEQISIYTCSDDEENIKLRDNPVLLRVINKFRSFNSELSDSSSDSSE